jgi:glycosyltransferase involved in cell wall biosynthesis
VVAYEMARELPRTVRSLAPGYQRGIGADDYEVVVVDNGSPSGPADLAMVSPPLRLRTMRIDPAPPSPASAANAGIQAAGGDVVGLIIDGARMASPGLLALARRAAGFGPRTIVATLAWHLGTQRHMDADDHGYDQAVEDGLLADVDWERDGYRLFEISTLAASSARGWFGPVGESSALFLSRQLWTELGGLDEAFALPGGGLVNHDLYRRACELDDVELVVLLGEGTFHQIHGGAATSRRFDWDDMDADYESRRGHPYRPPANEPLLFGTIPPTAVPHVEQSVAWAEERLRRGRPLRG